jgi:hypothetical protein
MGMIGAGAIADALTVLALPRTLFQLYGFCRASSGPRPPT